MVKQVIVLTAILALSGCTMTVYNIHPTPTLNVGEKEIQVVKVPVPKIVEVPKIVRVVEKVEVPTFVPLCSSIEALLAHKLFSPEAAKDLLTGTTSEPLVKHLLRYIANIDDKVKEAQNDKNCRS